jgi:hypothetical protein
LEAVVSGDNLYLPSGTVSRSDSIARSTRPAPVVSDDDIEDPGASTYLTADHRPDPEPAWVIPPTPPASMSAVS